MSWEVVSENLAHPICRLLDKATYTQNRDAWFYYLLINATFSIDLWAGERAFADVE